MKTSSIVSCLRDGMQFFLLYLIMKGDWTAGLLTVEVLDEFLFLPLSLMMVQRMMWRRRKISIMILHIWKTLFGEENGSHQNMTVI